MSMNEGQGTGVSRSDLQILHTLIRLIAFQIAVLIGLVIVLVQVAGLPDQTAQPIPIQSSGQHADAAAGPILSGVSDIQTSIDALTVEINAICSVVSSTRPTAASPAPCNAQ
jgi:hypothetical protein